MEAQPALKRKRVDGASAVRDPNFYFEDGNIVLSAKDPEDCVVYFRLHRSIVSKHSPVFADMFTLPPPASAEQYDGVPLVEMAGDSAETLRSLIALLYDPQCITTILNGEDFATRMYEPVVLARKYQIDWIRKMVASHLKNQWTLTLVGWDRVANSEVSDALASEDGYWKPDDSLKLPRLPEPVTAIRLARECDVPEVLPLAFLHLLRQRVDINSESDDDTDDEDDLHARVWQVPERQLLTTADLERLILARERIGRWFANRRDTHWQQDLEQCKLDGFADCHLTILRIQCAIATSVARDGNVLAASQWILQNGGPTAGVCPGCRTGFRDEIRDMRETFFDRLRTFFSL
ncbi:hypothetical protein DFH06DRAFT_424841 [Mycena polygramma]|nr:hypothetical protein DFH06DRAFT_424841 [Mycena polygramma]